MMDELTSTTAPDYMATLSKVAISARSGNRDAEGGLLRNHRPAAKVVVSALLQAERAAKQQHLVYPLESLLGEWRLYFTASRKAKLQNGVAQGNGFYIPQIVPAQISFNVGEQLEIDNQIQFGSLLFKLAGPARYLCKKNLLAFDFTQMQVRLFNRTIYQGKFSSGKTASGNFEQQPISKLPFFAFFLITEDYIAARGRGGGLAIWVKQTL